MNSETTVNEEKTATRLVNGLGRHHVHVRSFGSRSAAGDLDRNRHCARVADLVVGGCASDLRLSFSDSIGGALWKLLLAVFYGFTGFYMVTHPILGVATVTIVLAVFLFCEGVVEIAFYFHIRRAANAVWVLFDGIVTLILGYLIWAHWPSNLDWVLGTLVGISLMFSGISRFMLSRAFPRLPLS